MKYKQLSIFFVFSVLLIQISSPALGAISAGYADGRRPVTNTHSGD